jgi:hypothetical protein
MFRRFVFMDRFHLDIEQMDNVTAQYFLAIMREEAKEAKRRASSPPS